VAPRLTKAVGLEACAREQSGVANPSGRLLDYLPHGKRRAHPHLNPLPLRERTTRQRQVRVARDKKTTLLVSNRELAGRLLPLRATRGHVRTPKSRDCGTKLKHSGGYILHAVLWECDASSHCCHLPCACRNWPFAASISRCVCWQRRIPRSLSP